MDTSLSEAELEALEVERADRSIFMQDLLLNTLMMNMGDDRAEPKQQPVRERAATASHQPASQSSPQTPQQSQPAHTQANNAAISERPKNGSSSAANGGGGGSSSVCEQPTAAKRSSQQRTSPSTERTSNQRTITPQNRASSIEYVLSSRPHQPSTESNSISVREVLVGNNYTAADTARRKPICTVDSINQTTEPPTSH